MDDRATVRILTELSHRVAALERRSPPASEQLTPNYLTIAGNPPVIGASFTGQVHAQGLNLDEAITDVTPPDQDTVRWLRTTDQAVAAKLSSQIAAAGTLSQLQLTAFGVSGGVNEALAVLAATSQDLSSSSLRVDTPNAGGNPQSIQAWVPAIRNTIIDSLGRSSYLQLLSTQKLRLAFGAQAITVVNGIDANVTFAHGLGAIPTVALGTPNIGPGVDNVMVTVNGFDATNITMSLRSSSGGLANPSNFTIYWIALG